MQQIMNNKIKRRDFVQISILSTGSVLLGACNAKDNSSGNSQRQDIGIDAPDEMSLSKSMPREQVFQLLDQKVIYYMELSHNCAQSSFLALSEQFGLENSDMVKALTPLPGIAERGETCGAVTGALLALGLVFGRENISDWQAYRDSLKPANEFCDRFIEELGSTMCSDIVESKFGQRLDLRKTDDLSKFQESNATAKCSKVVQTAVKIAADIILKT
jgi:C_GCAxxG_C_C family probable redox protein